MNLYDPQAETHRSAHCLPHWMQDGTITFITMRQADSLPKSVIERWERERIDFLRQQGVRCTSWKTGRTQLSAEKQRDFDKCFQRKKEIELDRCHGSCRLADQRAAQIVYDSLLHFDNERYLVGDFVIMPNHVHCLVVFPNAAQLRMQCYSWMHFTAVRINRIFGQSGSFWQEEPFDHLVRSERQLEYLRNYIGQNPMKANLPTGHYLYRRSQRAY